MAGGTSLEAFLQDVLGRDEALTPNSGRLRQIHARIAKEVEDAKQELHKTVQSQWPTLQRQYGTTIDLVDRLKGVQGDVQSLEVALDGDESALRPRLQASFTAHTDLSIKHQQSQALVDLLQSLQQLQNANQMAKDILAQGMLDEVLPSLEEAERLINGGMEEWKKDCEIYRRLKRHHERIRAIAVDRLEEALSRCIVFGQNHISLNVSVANLTNSMAPYISLHDILKAYAALSNIEKQFERIAQRLLDYFVRPVLVFKNSVIVSDEATVEVQTVHVERQPQYSIENALQSLGTLLLAFKASSRPRRSAPTLRQLFLSFLLPDIQQLLISEVLEKALPRTANQAELERLHQVCELVAAFEDEHMTSQMTALKPLLRNWAQDASKHWSDSIIERCFSILRTSIATSQYWDKTEQVDWTDDPSGKYEEESWKKWLAGSTSVPQLGQPPAIQTATVHKETLQASNSSVSPVARPSSSTQMVLDDEPEDAAWGFDDNDEKEEQAHNEAKPEAGSTKAPPALTAEAEAEEDGWSFEEDELDEAGDAAAKPPHTLANGHKRNASKSSTHSKRSTASRGQRAGPSTDDEEDAAGWSFDADDVEIEQEHTSTVSSPTKAHARQSSTDEAWGWNPDLDNDERKPIGKPTKVINSKRLGGKGRANDSQVLELDTSVASSALGETVSSAPREVEPSKPSVPEQVAPTLPSVPVVLEPALMTEETKFLVSTRSKQVGTVAKELLDAALSVSALAASTNAFAGAARRLLKAYTDAYDLYRAIMPVAHSSLLSSVPSIGMQFSNDCLFVAREGGQFTQERLSPTAAHSSKLDLTKNEQEGLQRSFMALKAYGERVLDEQINLQRAPLMETLNEADGFRNTDDPRAFAQCQRCVRQLVHTLTSISHAWKPVLLRRVYLENMGVLLNAVLLRMLVEIEDQEDISEESSHRLNDLCKMMHELEGLFTDENGQSTVALHVPVWFKFKFLSELLEASMADIMYLHTEGHLVDFSATELSKLVRALFAESHLRQRNLETIARGR